MTQSSKSPETENDGLDAEQGLLGHLIELRTRLMRSVLVMLVVILALYPFDGQIFTWLSGPLIRHLPQGGHLIATAVADTFLVPFKLVVVLSFVISLPYILHQVWSFVAPGLYRHERRLAVPLLVSSVLLFYLGMAFAYFVVFPLVFGFFTRIAPQGVEVMTDMGHYLNFVLKMFMAFGAAFEVPVATVLLVMAGVVSPDDLARKRPYVIVAAFVIGMLLTPPDIVSQTMLALPIWLLFEVGLVFSRMVVPKPTDETDEDADEGGDEGGPSDDQPPPSSPTPPRSPPRPHRPAAQPLLRTSRKRN
jgi:sec-independent protein translocase protein TatC